MGFIFFLMEKIMKYKNKETYKKLNKKKILDKGIIIKKSECFGHI